MFCETTCPDLWTKGPYLLQEPREIKLILHLLYPYYSVTLHIILQMITYNVHTFLFPRVTSKYHNFIHRCKHKEMTVICHLLTTFIEMTLFWISNSHLLNEQQHLNRHWIVLNGPDYFTHLPQTICSCYLLKIPNRNQFLSC